MGNRNVYLDNNAATRVDERVVRYMDRFHESDFAVASSQFSHTPGIKAKDAVEQSRETVAKSLGAGTDEIVFTSGGTESNNLALLGIARGAGETKRNRIVISAIEHFSVLHSADRLAREGYEVKKSPVDGEGFVDTEALSRLVNDRTLLVSVMHANHEVGTLQDLAAISAIAHRNGAYFHTDASYSFLQIPIDVKKTGIDLLTADANMVHGPKGTGALYIRKNVPLSKIFEGGYQEYNIRPGTENVPGIAGFGKAVEIWDAEDVRRTALLRDDLKDRLVRGIEGTLINGPQDMKKRIPNNINVSFNYIEGESVVLHLDMRGIAVITGSACFSRALQASHVLLAMGFTHERAHGSIRFSPSKYTVPEDIVYTYENVQDVVARLRELSPVGKK
ncbi:MAG: cysteine desulfurase [Spirochaetes bacterium]|nr:cysteine desulfurase [Spirochaetota bacterium]